MMEALKINIWGLTTMKIYIHDLFQKLESFLPNMDVLGRTFSQFQVKQRKFFKLGRPRDFSVLKTAKLFKMEAKVFS